MHDEDKSKVTTPQEEPGLEPGLEQEPKTEPKQDEKNWEEFLEKLDPKEKQELAEKVGARYLEENKSLRNFKKKIEKEREEAERKALEEKGEYEKLAKLHEQKMQAYQSRIASNALKEALIEKGVSTGLAKITTQAYQSKLEIDEDDNVANLNEVIAELESTSPELFTKPKGGFTPPTNTAASSNGKMLASQWLNLPSVEKAKVMKERGVDYTK